jgi:hypothetical protein
MDNTAMMALTGAVGTMALRVAVVVKDKTPDTPLQEFAEVSVV